MIIAAIVIGSVLMIANIIAYICFIRNSTDVMLSGKHGEPVWESIGLILLIFFLLGYIGVAYWGNPDLLTAGILFFGSIFVSLALKLMFHLVYSLKNRSIEITETLIGVMDARDTNLNGHSRHVQNLCMLLFRHLPPNLKSGISPVSFEYAALLHDVGKLGIPEKILNKPDKLDDDEWAVMRQHPRIAMDLLKSLPSFNEIKDWILYHHERMDGRGYYGMPADEIPIAARIIALCDTYSAITMIRSYKEARPHEEAIRIIQEVSGTQLDPELVSIFVNIPKEDIKACEPKVVDLDKI